MTSALEGKIVGKGGKTDKCGREGRKGWSTQFLHLVIFSYTWKRYMQIRDGEVLPRS